MNVISSLQVLRCFCCLGVIISHSCILPNVQFARFAVSTFFILSSFLFSIKENNSAISIKNNVLFSLNRFKKIYPLHLLCTFIMIPLFLYGTYISKIMDYSLTELILCLLSHITLTQTFILRNERLLPIQIYNCISWYLSSLILYYFILPFCTLIKKILSSINKTIAIYLLIYVFYFFILFTIKHGNYIHFDAEYYFYFSPIIRVFDCVLGYLLGKIYLFLKINANIKLNKSLVLFSFVSLLSLFLYQYNAHVFTIYEYDFIYIPIICLLIVCLSLNDIFTTKVKISKSLIYIGNVSGYMYLIAGVVMDYSMNIYQFLFHQRINKYILAIIVFIISYFLARLYKKILDMFIKKKTI